MGGPDTGHVEEDGEVVPVGRPRAAAVRPMFDDVRAAPAALTFLRDTRVRRMFPWLFGGSGEERTLVGS